MKVWWQQLNNREQRLVVAMGLFFIVFIFYSTIWKPINNSIIEANSKLARQQELLTWVQDNTALYKQIKIINLWIVRQLKNEYNPIHYHEGQLSGVGYLRIPKNMNQNKLVKNKKFKTNGTIDFINGQTHFLSKSIYNLNPKLGDLLIFPNYLMHTAYPFNVDGERRSFSFNAKILFKK
jgi:hypothetical protein